MSWLAGSEKMRSDYEQRDEMDRMLQAHIEAEIDLICVYADSVRRGMREPDAKVVDAICDVMESERGAK